MDGGRLSPGIGDDLKAISPETRLVPLSGFQFDSQCPPEGIESLEVGRNFSFFNNFFNRLCSPLGDYVSRNIEYFLLFKNIDYFSSF